VAPPWQEWTTATATPPWQQWIAAAVAPPCQQRTVEAAARTPPLVIGVAVGVRGVAVVLPIKSFDVELIMAEPKP
jgi:hypothetical protein